MPIKFCSNCGNKITFELQVPEKCPKCDKEINSALKTVPQTQVNNYQNINSQQFIKQRITNQSYNQNTELEESDDINFELIDQIKASLLRNLRGIDITVDNIPEFRVPIGRIAEEQARKNNNNNNQ